MNKLKNFGKVSQKWLEEVGVTSKEDIEKFGAIAIYRLIKSNHPDRVSLNLLWALEATVKGCDWREISSIEKERLKQLI